MAKLNGLLSGKKTYVASFLGALGFVASYFTGEATLVQAAQGIFTAILASAIRNGISNS